MDVNVKSVGKRNRRSENPKYNESTALAKLHSESKDENVKQLQESIKMESVLSSQSGDIRVES